MKKTLKKFVVVFMVFSMTVITVFCAAFSCEPFGDVFFSFCFGSCYKYVGNAVLHCNGRKIVLNVYKTDNKPFLLIGPYSFEDYKDFFFVNKKQVIGTAVDKGGDAWFRLGRYLFILDDLNHRDNLRMPWWDFMNTPSAKSEYKESTNCRIYIFPLDAADCTVQLEISEKFFTSDMLDAYNATANAVCKPELY